MNRVRGGTAATTARACLECGNDDPTEGLPFCSDCLEVDPMLVARLLSDLARRDGVPPAVLMQRYGVTPELLLRLLRAEADCTRRRVAALVLREGEVVGTGWNGLPEGSCTAGECPRGRLSYAELPPDSSYAGNCSAIHAEVAALRQAGERAVGATVYVTSPPCPGCQVALAESHVAEVVVMEPGSSAPATPATA